MIQVTCIEKENRKALASQCHPSVRAGPTCGNYIASQLRKANFHSDIDDQLQRGNISRQQIASFQRFDLADILQLFSKASRSFPTCLFAKSVTDVGQITDRRLHTGSAP